MKSLKTLIKLHKSHLDDLVLKINHSQQEKIELLNLLENNRKEVEAELKQYIGSEYAFIIDEYLKNSIKQQKSLQDNIAVINANLEILNNQLTEQYAELKKLEIAFENKRKQQLTALKKAEEAAINEFNVIRFNDKGDATK